MENSLRIGASPDKEGVAMVTAAVVQVLQTGHDLRVPEVLMEKALDLLRNAFEVKNVTVTNCTFTGTDNKVTIEQPQE